MNSRSRITLHGVTITRQVPLPAGTTAWYTATVTSAEYDEHPRRVAALVEQKNYDEAVKILQMLMESDLPALDRSIMSINMAVVCDLMGHVDHALAWYDHGIALEQPLMRCLVALHKASYLAGKGRNAESAEIYQRVAEEPYLMLSELESARANLKAVRSA